jgi:hypothetical protein
MKEEVMEVVGVLILYEDLPAEIKCQVFGHLDPKSLSTSCGVCKEWNSLIDQSVWKLLCLRDWPDFVHTKPLSVEHKANFEKQFEEDLIEEQYQRNQDSELPSYSTNSKRFLYQSSDSIEHEVKDWRAFYQLCSSTFNLNGLWTADYGAHGEELIKVTHHGFYLNAIKVTGDVNVPAGKPTWNMTLYKENTKEGTGELHLADTGYKNPRWGQASIEIKDKNTFTVLWYFCFPSSLVGPTRGVRWHTITLNFQRSCIDPQSLRVANDS